MDIYLLECAAREAATLAQCLQERRHAVRQFAAEDALLAALTGRKPHLVVFDPFSGGGTGLSTLRRIRCLHGDELPILLATSERRPERIVAALEAGADGYVGQPAVPAVLVAHIEALLRRAVPPAHAVDLRITRGPYELDYRRQVLAMEGQPVALTPKEFDLAWALFSRPDGFVSRDELVAAVWGKTAVIAGHTFAQHVYLLRKKLKLQAQGFRLTAVYRAGYRWESPAAG